MLDKSIPYYNLIMRYRADTPVPEPLLPQGYSLRTYRPGDELSWAEIEAAVGEFDTAEDALHCFEDHYMPYPGRLERRCLFACDDQGRPAATCTAWWNARGNVTVPALHWIGVHPDHQGRGLGKAVVFRCVRDMADLEPGQDLWLHTQSWSWRAIGIYLEAGFTLEPVETLDQYRNEYELALPWLQQKMRPDLFALAAGAQRGGGDGN